MTGPRRRAAGARFLAFTFALVLTLVVTRPARADEDASPHGAVYIDEWAGRDAEFHSGQVDVAGGLGVAYHALELPIGCLHRSWGAGAHFDVAVEVVHGATAVLLHFDTEVYSKRVLSDGVVRGTVLLAVRFL